MTIRPTAPPARPGFTAPASGDLQVTVVPEELGLLDLVRQVETREVQGPDGSKTVETAPMPRSPLGVHLGGGLFYDFHGNLSLAPLLAFYAPVEAAVGAAGSFVYDPSGWGNSATVSTHGTRTSVDAPGLFTGVTVERRGSDLSISRTGFANDVTIRRTATETVIDPSGPFNEIRLTRDGGTVRFQAGPAGRSGVIEGRADGEIRITAPGALRSTSIQREGNRLEIDPPGFANSTTLTVAPDRITVDPTGWGNGTEVRLDGDTVKLDYPGVFQSAEIRRG